MPIRNIGGRSKKRTTRKAAKVTPPLGKGIAGALTQLRGSVGVLSESDIRMEMKRILKTFPEKRTASAGAARGARRGSGRR